MYNAEDWTEEYIANRLWEKKHLISGRKIALYPYGARALETERLLLQRFETPVTYRVDDMKQGNGILTLDEFYALHGNDRNVLLIFAVLNQTLFNQLLMRLLLKGFKTNKVLVLQKNMILAVEAVEKVLDMGGKKKVLDIGCGHGFQARIFQDFGNDVLGLTLDNKGGWYAGECIKNLEFVDFMNFECKKPFDVIWASHILEHIADVQKFINKMVYCCRGGGDYQLLFPLGKKTSV